MPKSKKSKGKATSQKSHIQKGPQAEKLQKKKSLLKASKEYDKKCLIIRNNLYRIGEDHSLNSIDKSISHEEKVKLSQSYKNQKNTFNKFKEECLTQLSLLVENSSILDISPGEIQPLLETVRIILWNFVKIELILDELDDAYATFIDLEGTFLGKLKDISILSWEETLTIKGVVYSYLAYRAWVMNSDKLAAIAFLLSFPPTKRWELFSASDLEVIYEFLLNLCPRDPSLILTNNIDPLPESLFYYNLNVHSAPQLKMPFVQAQRIFQEKIAVEKFPFYFSLTEKAASNLDRISQEFDEVNSNSEEFKIKINQKYEEEKEAFRKEKEQFLKLLSLLVDNSSFFSIPSKQVEEHMLPVLLERARTILCHFIKIELKLGKFDDAYVTFIDLEGTFFSKLKETSSLWGEKILSIKGEVYSYLAYRAWVMNSDKLAAIVFLLSIPPEKKWEIFRAIDLEAIYNFLLNFCSRDQNFFLINNIEPLAENLFYYDLNVPSAPKLKISFTHAAQLFQKNIVDAAFNFVSQDSINISRYKERSLMLLQVKAGLRAMLDSLKNRNLKASQDPFFQDQHNLLSQEEYKIAEIFIKLARAILDHILLGTQQQEESRWLEEDAKDDAEKREENTPVETNIAIEKRKENSEQITNETAKRLESSGEIYLDLSKILEFYERFFPQLVENTCIFSLLASKKCHNKEAEILFYRHLEERSKKYPDITILALKDKNLSAIQYLEAIDLIRKGPLELENKVEELLINSADHGFALAYIPLGEIYFRRGDIERSEKYYQKAEALNYEILNIRMAYSIYFVIKDKSKEKKAVFLLENAKDSGSINAAILLIYYNLSKILNISFTNLFSLKVEWDNPDIDPLLSLKQEHILRSLGLCMEAYAIDISHKKVETLNKLTVFIFELCIRANIFSSQILEKLKGQIENLFLRFSSGGEYVESINKLLESGRESRVLHEITASEEGSHARVERTESLTAQPAVESVAESAIIVNNLIVKETGSIKGHISRLFSDIKIISVFLFNASIVQDARTLCNNKRDILKEIFLEINNKIEDCYNEIDLYQLKSMIEIFSRLRINSNDPIFQKSFLNIGRIISVRISSLDLSNNISMVEFMIRQLYSLCFLNETEVKNIILGQLNLHLNEHLKNLKFDLIAKFSYVIATLIASHKMTHGEDAILPEIVVKAVGLLCNPAVEKKSLCALYRRLIRINLYWPLNSFLFIYQKKCAL